MCHFKFTCQKFWKNWNLKIKQTLQQEWYNIIKYRIIKKNKNKQKLQLMAACQLLSMSTHKAKQAINKGKKNVACHILSAI